MIINQHRKFTPINIFWVCAVGTILCLGAFFHLPAELKPFFLEPAVDNLLNIEFGKNLEPQSNVLITLVLTLLQAFLLNKVINHFNFLGKPTFLTALMFMTLVSLFLPFLVLSPTLICNFITIWMMGKLFNMYKQADVKTLMFDLGMIVALGSLIYFPFIVMLMLLWIALIIFRPFIWREWVTPILGFSVIYFLLGVAYYWVDRWDEFLEIFKPFVNSLPTGLKVDYHDYFVVFPVGIAMLLFLLVLKDQYFRSIVHIRKAFQLLFYMLLLIIGSFYLNSQITINHFLLCAPPLAIYLAYYFAYAKIKWLYESIYIIIVATIIYFQFM
ncbi:MULTISPECIES: DUF6427 family protein [Sphingobacterium]|uniref:Beta-carotene 15,15'-monooxygenase n=1 Tax=Sphingobacterium litopenaei TaxID=2763500 RepID=A0ABR7YAH3_9SPHI|nr:MULTISPECIES: DUF6427 family protein [Sphingobacterium]MBD1428304.1 beta-carotene 15,15'-monooxygenase [Sphingobacterium litopenaei]NGM72169.1 beta-carotene 15,15'-monooxygenase [Sphingobacterium sp. SGL-16]